MAAAGAGARRRRRHSLRLVRPLLGGARAAGRVRAYERRPAGGVGVAELRDSSTFGRRTGDRDPLRGCDSRPSRRRRHARAAARCSGRAVGESSCGGRTDRPSVGTRATSMPSSCPRSKSKPARCFESWGTSRSAPPGPGAPWRGAPAARSSGRGPRQRDRVSASAPGAEAGVRCRCARRALLAPHVRPARRAEP